jgi:hypothetical protein
VDSVGSGYRLVVGSCKQGMNLCVLVWRSTRPIQPHTRETCLLVISIFINML